MVLRNRGFSLEFQEMGKNELMELPPGFRFHPTDEKLITHYISACNYTLTKATMLHIMGTTWAIFSTQANSQTHIRHMPTTIPNTYRNKLKSININATTKGERISGEYLTETHFQSF